jgi:hypothetical protein
VNRRVNSLVLLLVSFLLLGRPLRPRAQAGEPEHLLVASFESPQEFFQWEKLRFPVQDTPQVFDIALSTERVSHGSSALKVTQPLAQPQRIAWGTEASPADWSGWERLAWDVYWDAPADTKGRLTVIVDVADSESTALWTDRFDRDFQIRPGWNTLSVSVDELQTRISARKVEQLAFGFNSDTPTTIYLDNVRLEGKRSEPLPEPELLARRQLGDRAWVWLVGDDFRRWQCVADGYYEPKGWEPSDDLVSSMQGLRLVEESQLVPDHEESTVWLTLAKDVHTRPGPTALTSPREIEAPAPPAEAGTVDFWVKLGPDTSRLAGFDPLVSARRDDANLFQIAFLNDDLFFEIRKDGQRYISRPWGMSIWGDIQKQPTHWRAASAHHVRVTWGPKGMYLYLDDQEVPYWPPSLSRSKDIQLPPSPYAGPAPAGLPPLSIGPLEEDKPRFIVTAVQVRKEQVLGPEWDDLPYVTSGELVSHAFDRGSRYQDPAFALRRFGYDADIPPGTSITFTVRGTSTIDIVPWFPVEWSHQVVATVTEQPTLTEETLAELSQYRYLQVKVSLKTDDPKVTPRLRRYYFLQASGKNPCLFLTEDKLIAVRQRCQGPNHALFERLKAVADRGEATPLGNAFLYQVTGEEKYAQQAKAKLDQVLEKRNYAEWDEAVAIDWLLPASAAEERLRYIHMLTAGLWDYGMLPEAIWWNQMYNNWRHAYTHTFLKNLSLVAQVAQAPLNQPLTEETLGFDLFRLKHSFDSTERFFRLFVIPAINRTGGVWPEGFGYHAFTGPGPALSVAAWESATGENLWKEARAFANVPAWYFYSRRPDVGRTVAVNDDREGQAALMSAWLPLLASTYRDPIAQGDAKAIADWMSANANQERPQVPGFGYYEMVDFLLWYDPTVPVADLGSLPLDRFFPEAGWVLMRSGWEKDATFALLMAGDWFGGHKHADTGSFVISKLGDLAIDPYDSRRDASRQHFAYRVKSIAHNVVAVDDPDEPAGDGGQHSPGFPELGDVTPGSVFDTATILAYQSTPEFNYTACDLTGAYGKWHYGYPRIVERYLRQFLYLRPNTFVAFDRVTLTDPKYTCRWLLHALAKPTIEGEGEKVDALVTRYPHAPGSLIEEGEGALRVIPLLPEDGSLTLREVQGTHENDTIVPSATVWQLELDQEKKTAERQFLVVMVAGSKTAPPQPKVKPLRQAARVGAEVTVDGYTYRVFFADSGDPAGSVHVIAPGGGRTEMELTQKVER